jgi:Dam-replacing family protein/DpnI-like restriction endonuclease
MKAELRAKAVEVAGETGNVPWPVAVSFLIRPLPADFALQDVYAVADPLRRAFPKNHNVEAKIRQSLQILRDRGEIAFEGGGRYRKLKPVVKRTVRIDFAEARQYVSGSQVARVAIEAWAASNVDCWRCKSPLLLVPPNRKLLDALCQRHGHEVQMKAVAGVAGDRLTAAAYGPMVTRIKSGVLPDYLIVSYDRLRSIVLLAEFVDGATLVADRVMARAPLSTTARRAGWIGATIDLSRLRRHAVVGPSFDPEARDWPSLGVG